MRREEKIVELMESIYELSNYINLYQSQPRTYGTEDILYMAETHLVQIIGKVGQTTITELAKKTHKTKSAISQTIDKLNAKDIVAKGKNPNDNKEIFVFLTQKGERINRFHSALDEKAYRAILNLLDDFELEDFDKCIKVNKIVTNENIKAIRMKKMLDK